MDLEPVPPGATFGQVNPVCLFFLAVLCFCWFLPVLMFLEMSLHIWAHHKNKTLKDANVYFRSPFHGISSEFCALCQNETCMNRVGKMQQIRMHKFLRQCNYMKRVVTWNFWLRILKNIELKMRKRKRKTKHSSPPWQEHIVLYLYVKEMTNLFAISFHLDFIVVN